MFKSLIDAAGSSITQDGQTDILEGASGGASYQYVAGECYDESLNPVTFYAKDGKAWIQNNQNSTNWGGERVEHRIPCMILWLTESQAITQGRIT